MNKLWNCSLRILLQFMIFMPVKSNTFLPYPSCWRIIPGGYLLIIWKRRHWLWYGLRGDGCMLPEILAVRLTG